MNFNEFLNEKYSKEDINTLYGFYGAMEDEHNEKIADEIFDAAVKDLMKEFGLKDTEAVALLNSKAGRQAADAMIAGECEDSVIAGMYWYFGKNNKSKVVAFAKKSVNESEEISEASKFGAPAGLTKAETKKVAETLAKAMSKAEGAKVTVNLKTLEEDSFDLDYDGEEYDGGSYNIYDDGSVVNHAVTPNEIYGKMDSSVEDFIKGLKKPIKESLELNEGAKFKNTKDFEKFLEEIDGMGDAQIKKIMGKDYIDTPGYYSEEAEDYDNDIIEFMISNMGTKEFEKLKDYWENNVAESRITLKRQYTENYPAKTVGKHAAIRNKIIEALKDGELTKEEFDTLVSGLTEDSKRWLRRNAEFFNIQEDKVGLSRVGQKIASTISQVAEGGYRPMTDAERQKKQYRDQQLKRLRAVDKKEADKKKLLALQQKMHQAKLKKANENNNNMENKFIYESFSDFVNSKNTTNESFELVVESFKSSMLAGLFMRSGKFDANLAKSFYGATKLKLDQIEDEDLLTTTPASAYKNKQDNTIVFYISDTEKPNPHAPEDAYYSNKTIPGQGYLLAVASGDNKFYDQVWASYQSKTRTMRTVDNNPSDSIGIGKKYSGWDATGLYNVKRIAEVADRAIIVNVALLAQKYSADAQRAERRAAKAGATAFKSDKDFKAENKARYNQILAQKVASMPLDSLVGKAIETMSEQIRMGLEKKETGRYGEIIVGKNPKGAEVKMADVAYHMKNILDDYSRYVGVVAQQEASVAKYGEAESWYKKEVQQKAVELKGKLDQVESFSYVW